MIKWSYIAVVAAALLLPCLTVRADELSDLKARVDKLEKGQASSNLDWSADLRYRHESIYKQDSEHYDRDRIRVRVKVVGQVNDDTKLTVRVASVAWATRAMALKSILSRRVSPARLRRVV